jgi:WG containing repeat
MRCYLPLWAICLILSCATEAFGETGPLAAWYPFLSGNKWGFIDAAGAWKIPPAYDYACDVFDHEIVRVSMRDKFGYIDREGQWVTKPQFDFLSPYFEDGDLQVVGRKKKFGILNRQGRLVVPLEYDAVVLSKDRAWARKGDELGIFGLDGKWIHPLTIRWPISRSMPRSLNADNVAWFKDAPDSDGKWGVMNAEGTIVFPPRFDAHQPGRHDAESWDHPEGTDFVHGRAWVFENGACEFITSHGDVSAHLPFRTVSAWSGDFSIFSDKGDATFGIVSSAGDIVLPARACEIQKPVEDLAKYHWGNWFTTGFLNPQGQPVMTAGQRGFVQDPSEGLIAASRQAQRLAGSRVSDPRGIFLDLSGKEVPITDDRYFAVGSFSDSLAAVQDVVEVAPGSTPHGGKWGYIDKTGAEKIAPQFGAASRFCHGRAWVSRELRRNGSPMDSNYALIDETGKVLTDFCYMPPDLDRPGIEVATAGLPEVRWRGNLVVLDQGWQTGLGLASADGTILVPPQFNSLGSLTDGMILCIALKGENRWTGYINAKGQLVIPPTYSAGTDFDRGAAWVTRQPNDHRVHPDNLGWILIDHQGQQISEDSYLSPTFINEEHYLDMGGLTDVPQFLGDLASVTDAKTYFAYETNRLQRLSWGYIDRTGKIVAWHKGDPK